MVALIEPLEKPLVVGSERPFVIMVTGVNGAGKTTSIGKLAKWFQAQDLSVLLAAGDTFRAAAREQLVVWGERNASRSSRRRAAIRPPSCSTQWRRRERAASTWC